MTRGALVLGTRGSALARRQARFIKHTLERAGFRIDLKEISTAGDRVLDVPLSQIGDVGVFTKELDLALLEGRIHVAVHSLKDLPTRLPDGIRLAAVPEREDPRDAFVAHPRFAGSLNELPTAAILATSSPRRTAQLRAWRDDLEVVSVRGNVDSRLNKLDGADWHGLILAVAGLRRLGLEPRIREAISFDVMLPAVGQGALGVVCDASDEDLYAVLHDILHDSAAGFSTSAERAMLRKLEGGCSVPVGAYARVSGGTLLLDGCVTALDGTANYRDQVSGRPNAAEQMGLELAERLLSRGAGAVLNEIRGR